MWGNFLSNYKHFSCQSSCLLLLLEYCKNHYRKENISVDGSKQDRDILFWIHLRDLAKRIYITLGVHEFLNIHIFNWYKAFYSASSSIFWHTSWFHHSSSMASWSFTHGVFLKTDSYVFINTWNNEFYIPLLLRQKNQDTRYDIDYN